jgi:hypothetical protein
VSADVHHDASAPLRDVPPINDSGRPKHVHERELEIPHPSVQGPEHDPVLQTDGVQSAVATSAGINIVGVGNGFPNFTVYGVPPYTNGANGATQYVQWVN